MSGFFFFYHWNLIVIKWKMEEKNFNFVYDIESISIHQRRTVISDITSDQQISRCRFYRMSREKNNNSAKWRNEKRSDKHELMMKSHSNGWPEIYVRSCEMLFVVLKAKMNLLYKCISHLWSSSGSINSYKSESGSCHHNWCH